MIGACKVLVAPRVRGDGGGADIVYGRLGAGKGGPSAILRSAAEHDVRDGRDRSSTIPSWC